MKDIVRDAKNSSKNMCLSLDIQGAKRGNSSVLEYKIKLFMKKLKERNDFDRVKFVILFGSQAEGRANKMSDYDFAVYYGGDNRERFDFRISFGGILPDNFDLQIFQDLPLYVRKEVLKGKVVYAEDMRFVYDVAYETIKAFGDFKKYYYDYLDRRPIVI